jgi:DNA-binding winged helix-turn-helix (wHTH) protein/tetratricopeptide (TPR) repeat protein
MSTGAMRAADFLFGDWAVEPAANRLAQSDQARQVEPRAMDVLVALCARPGEVLSAEDLLLQCWGDTPLGDNPVHKTIAQLRRALGDSATEPRYIETIRKRGYRALAPVRSNDGSGGQAREGAWTGGSPFRGLLAFDQAHAEVFYGREAATRSLLDCTRTQLRQSHGLCLVLGPSGSGKTSLVLAGLFPALLRAGGFDGIRALSGTSLDLGDVIGDGGSQGLLTALASALLDWELDGGRPMFPGASAASLAAHLQDGIEMVQSEMEWALRPHASEAMQPLQLLFIDRLEALFVAPQFDEAQRQSFLNALDALATGGRVLIVAACRNDFYPRLAEYPLLMRNKAQGAHFDLAPPTRAEIAQMIRLPARAAGLSFGHDAATQTRLDDVLCDDAAQSPDALPLLQYTLEELYRQREPHGELSFEAYKRLGGQVPGGPAGSAGGGGLEGAIGLRAESLIAALLPIQQAALPHVLSLLVMLSGDEARVTSRRALWSELRTAAERELVQALVDARLLVSDLIDEQAGFRVAHEAILRRWPRVTDWIAAHLQALQLRSRLRAQVQRWLDEHRSSDYLLPKGKQLSETRELLQRVEFSFSPPEQDFVQASLRRVRFGERLRMSAVAGIAAMAVLAGGLAWRANKAEHIAQQRSAQADDLVGYMLGDFADKLRPIGRLELLDNVGAKAMEHLAAAQTGETDAHSVLQRAKALIVIGEVRVSRAELEAARKPLTLASEMLAAAQPAPPDASDWIKSRGAAAFWLGHILYLRREFSAALQAFEDYRRFSAQMLERAPGQADAIVELSYAQNSLGSVLLELGELQKAEQAFRASMLLKTQARGLRRQDLTLEVEWLDSVSWLGTALLWQGEAQQAHDLFKQGVEGAAKVRATTPGDLEWMHREAVALYWLGSSQRQLGATAQARHVLEQANVLLRTLRTQDTRRADWRDSQIRVATALASLLPPGSPDRHQRLKDADAMLPRTEPAGAASSDTLMLRSFVHAALSDELQNGARPGEAQALLAALLPQFDQVLQKSPRDLQMSAERAKTRLRLVKTLRAQNDAPGAQRQCQLVLNELEEMRGIFRVHFDITHAWVAAHSCLGLDKQVKPERDWLNQREARSMADPL